MLTHKELSDRALTFLLPFTTTYLCENFFSSMLYIKSKYRTKLVGLESNLRLKMTKIEPNINKLYEKNQIYVNNRRTRMVKTTILNYT